jgi:exopolysaccharide biosynthesis polyprenyl glycosylphosphotransferase
MPMFSGEFKRQKVLFAIVDSLALGVVAAGALAIYDPGDAMRRSIATANAHVLIEGSAISVIIWLGVFRAFDLYHLRNGGRKETFAIVKACAIAVCLIVLGSFWDHQEISRICVAIGCVLSAPTVIVLRTLLRSLIRELYSKARIATPLVILGFNPLAYALCDRIAEELTQYEILGFLASGGVGREYRGHPLLGRPEQLTDLLASNPCLEVAIAMPEAPLSEQAELIKLCEESRLDWWVVPWFCESLSGGLKLDAVGSIPLVGCRRSNIEGFNYLIKRSFDMVGATLLLGFALPLIAIAALAIVLFDGYPVLFRQQRIGTRGRRFQMLKLRTMTSGTADIVHRDFVKHWIHGNQGARQSAVSESGLFKLSSDPRITKVGKILRRFSIDEFPQLWNVVRGDMSLIGPRPALPYELDLYQNWHRRRLDGMPGITGLWQVSGRNQVSFDAMVRLDLTYLQEWSLVSDLRILLKTIPVLLRGEGL